MEEEVRVIKKLAPFVSEPFIDDKGLIKYRVSRYTAHLESGDIYIQKLFHVFFSDSEAEAYAHKLNEDLKNEGNL